MVLEAPTRDGDREVRILSSLPLEVSAARVASLYLARWSIESARGSTCGWSASTPAAPKKPVPKRRHKTEPHIATARPLNTTAKEDRPKRAK
jgi:hypothetical protein